jgi:hypothetical protein
MNRRRISGTTILSDQEVRETVQAIRTFLGQPFVSIADSYGASLEDEVRFGPLARRCEQKRTVLGRSVKEVAVDLGVSQYRLKAIEAGTLAEIKPKILLAYISYLGLQRWYARWRAANPEIAGRVAMDAKPPARGRGRAKGSSKQMQRASVARMRQRDARR